MMFWSMHSKDENPKDYRGLGGDTIELRVSRYEWFNMSDRDTTELMLTGEKTKHRNTIFPLCIALYFSDKNRTHWGVVSWWVYFF